MRQQWRNAKPAQANGLRVVLPQKCGRNGGMGSMASPSQTSFRQTCRERTTKSASTPYGARDGASAKPAANPLKKGGENVIGALFGGIIRGFWYVTKALWSHPVLRLVILGGMGIWLLPIVWWPRAEPPGSHAYTIAGIVAGAGLIWWLLIGDTVHHLYPRPWLMSVMRMGFPILCYPLVAAWNQREWVAAGIVVVAALVIGIVPYFTNKNSRRGIS